MPPAHGERAASPQVDEREPPSENRDVRVPYGVVVTRESDAGALAHVDVRDEAGEGVGQESRAPSVARAWRHRSGAPSSRGVSLLGEPREAIEKSHLVVRCRRMSTCASATPGRGRPSVPLRGRPSRPCGREAGRPSRSRPCSRVGSPRGRWRRPLRRKPRITIHQNVTRPPTAPRGRIAPGATPSRASRQDGCPGSASKPLGGWRTAGVLLSACPATVPAHPA